MLLHPSAGGYGADRQLFSIATGLDPGRYRALVVLGDEGPLGRQLNEAGVEVEYADMAVLRRHLLRGHDVVGTAARRRRNRRELAALACEKRVGVVHSNSSIVLSGQAIADSAGLPHLLHLREIYSGAGGRAGELLWPLMRRRILRADAVACVSQAVAAQLAGSLRGFLLYDGLPRDIVVPPRGAARHQLGIEDDRFVVAMIGRISDWKGHDLFLRALADGPMSEIGAVGLVAGDAAPDQRYFEDDLSSLAEHLGLNGRLRMLGFRDDIGPLLAASDAVVVPSRHPDSLPNTALEAAVAQLPIVATSVGGLPEIVRDGVTGRLVPAADVARLGEALRALADDPSGAKALGQEAAADVGDRFDRVGMLDKLQDRYDRLVAARKPTAWLVATKELAVSQPAAPQLRLSRMQEWLRGLGYETSVVSTVPLVSLGWTTIRALRRPPRLLLTNTARAAPLARLVRWRARGRTVVVADVIGLHSLEIDQASRAWARPLLRPIWRRLERMLVRSADLVTTVNDRHADLIRRRYRADSVSTLRDGAEPELESVMATPRRELGIPEDAVAVGFVGSLVNDRLRVAFDAWSLLQGAPTERTLCLLVVGDGPDLETYRAQAAREGWLGDSVVFTGPLPRAKALSAIRGCDIAYSDCWTDAGFPAKIFEYMALGLPIVTEGKSQMREVLEEDRDALFFATPGELAAAIDRLAADADLRERLGTNAREQLSASHGLEERRLRFESLVTAEAAEQAAGEPKQPRRPRERGRPSFVSVVMPIRNEERHVGEQLAALAAQTYQGPWELIVADNGSTDRSIEIVESWRDRLPSLRVVDAGPRKGLNHARNRGADAARGDFLAYCDADDVVCTEWLDALTEAAENAELIGGATDLESLNPPEVSEWLRGTSLDGLHGGYDFLPYVSGGNCGVWADVAREIGWDESFRFGSSDIEFAWRLQLRSYRVAVAPGAVLHRRIDPGLRSIFRQHFAYGRSEPHLYRVFREHGMSRRGMRPVVGQWATLGRTAVHLAGSRERRGRWLRFTAARLGRAVGSVRWRVVFL